MDLETNQLTPTFNVSQFDVLPLMQSETNWTKLRYNVAKGQTLAQTLGVKTALISAFKF